MIIGVFIVGIIIFALIILCFFIDRNDIGDFDTGVLAGGVMTILFLIEICLISSIIEKPAPSAPSALDVYRRNTELEITYKDSIAIDSVVVWKEEVK